MQNSREKERLLVIHALRKSTRQLYGAAGAELFRV